MAELKLPQAISRFKTDENRYNRFINGSVAEDVPVESGTIPSLRKAISNLMATDPAGVEIVRLDGRVDDADVAIAETRVEIENRLRVDTSQGLSDAEVLQAKENINLEAYDTVNGRAVLLSHPGITPADVGAPVVNDPVWLDVHTDSYGKAQSGTRAKAGIFDAYEAKAFATVSHIVVLSQSLGLGYESLPAISTGVNSYNGRIFGRGFATWVFNDNAQTPAARSDAQFDLQPMTEFVSPYFVGETIANGLVAGLKSRMSGFFSSQDFTNTVPYFLLTNACEGSRLLTEIGPEDSAANILNGGNRGVGGYYKTTIDDMWRAKIWANKNGLDYDVPAIIWMQGEEDAGLRRLYGWESPYGYEALVAGYRDKLANMADAINPDIAFITGSARRRPFLTYQTSDTVIGEAQTQASENGTDIFMVGPTYAFPSAKNSVMGSGAGRTYGSPIHLSADATRWFGEHVAKALAALRLSGTRWAPLKRHAVRKINNTTIELELTGVKGQLVIDTDFLAAAFGFGFEIWSGTPDDRIAGTPTRMYPTSITITGPANLMMQFPSSIASGPWYLRYGGVFGCDLGVTLTVASVRNGPLVDGLPSKELVMSSNVLTALGPLIREGAFNSIRGSVQMPIRSAYNEGGVTVLRGLTAEVTGGTMVPGSLTVARWTGYGNIRDSDDSLSAYGWSNQPYHQRTGRYPLWNWLCMFDNMRIS